MKVLVAIDNKPSSQAILDALIKMHWYEATEIDLLTVLPPGEEYGTGKGSSAAAEEVESLVIELVKTLGQCEVKFFARHGDARAVIVEMADQLKADLIVLGSNCKNTLERVLIGSVCQAVINGASCPVIIAKTPCNLARESSPAFQTILLPIDNSIYSDVAVKWLGNFSWAPNTRFVIA
jgi:nucleotide-binding universal stress UspA family protein